MNKVIIYFPYPLKIANTGSSVRPNKMLEAFREYTTNHGLELIEIYGESIERKEKVEKFIKSINPKEILFCYMENSTLPYWLTDKDHIPRTPFLELLLFRYFKKNNIPLGIFYRDVYWLFDEEYSLKGIKKSVMRAIYRLEKNIYKKFANKIFLPSNDMNEYLDFPVSIVSSLPPGSEKRFLPNINNKTNTLNIIYVGAISEKMGLSNMLKAVKIVNESNVRCKLLLICRLEDYNLYKKDLLQLEKLNLVEVRQAFGQELYALYENADIAIIPREKNVYNDFAVPVKLFEYLSFGLPVVSTDNNAVTNIIQEGPYGIIVKSNPEDLSNAIIKLNCQELRTKIKNNISRDIPNKHLWINRVEKIFNDLCTTKRVK